MVKKSEGRKEELKEESAEKKDTSKTWADNYTTFSKMWEDSYSSYTSPWIESTGDMFEKMALLSKEATPQKYKDFFDEWIKTYQDTFGKFYPIPTPEVSLVMKQLKEFDWINESEEKKPGKGRPYKIYSLKIGFKDIIAQLEKQQKKVVDEAQEKIKRLKELVREGK